MLLVDEIAVAEVRDKLYHYQRRVKEESLKDPAHRLDDPRQYDSVELDKLAGVARKLLGSELTGRKFLVEVVHAIIWTQCFSDGNHRTAVATVQALAAETGFAFGKTKPAFLDSTTKFIDRSHTYTDLDRWPYTPAQRARYKEKQRTLVAEWVDENLAAQVGSLAMVGSHSLRAFSSRGDT